MIARWFRPDLQSAAEPRPARDPRTNLFARIARFSVGHAGAVVFVYAVLAMGALVLSVTRLEIDTNPARMIATDLPFRQHFADLNRTFPQFDNTFVVVIDGQDPDQGRAAARAIAAAFRARPDLFPDVYAPGTEAFFDEFGVLYLEPTEVAAMVEHVKQSKLLFQTLAEKPNMIGLAELFDLMLLGAELEELPELASLFLRRALRTLDGQLTGADRPFQWDGLVGKVDRAGPTRWYVIVKPELDFRVLDPAEAPLAEANRILRDPVINPLGPDRARLTGEAAVNAEELRSVTEGAALAGLIAFCIVTLVVAIGLPAARLILPAIAMLVIGFLLNAGFATLAIGYLNLISVAFVVLFIGLGIDYAVHVVLRFHESARSGLELESAICDAVAGIGPALALCTLTTTLAFLTFSLTDFVGMAQLGVIAAAGILIAFLASLTLIPALLSFVPLPTGALRPEADSAARRGAGSRPARFWNAVAVAVMLGAAACAFLIPQVRFDGDPINLKDPDAPAVLAFNDVVRDDAGIVYAAQVLASDEDEARRLMPRLAALPTVRAVRSVETFIPDGQQAKIAQLRKLGDVVPRTVRFGRDIGDEARRTSLAAIVASLQTLSGIEEASVDVRALAGQVLERFRSFEASADHSAAQLKALEQAFFANLPQLFQRLRDLSALQPLDRSRLPDGIRSRYVAPDGRWRLEVVPRGDMRNESEMTAFVAGVTALAPNATAAPVEITGAAATVASAMWTASLASLALIALILAAIFRRFSDVALALAPVVLAMLLLLAYTVVFDAPFNFANIIVIPLLIGLGVDSSIHFVMRLRGRRHTGRLDLRSTPRAVVISALTTIGSFGTLWLSPHLGLSSMGELLTVSICATLLCTLVVLRQLIQWAGGSAGTRGA